MKIYIASRFADREKLRPIRDKIWAIGHELTNSWLDEVAKIPGMTTTEFWRKLAIKDLCEIAAADLLIRSTQKMSHTGGADCEVGFTLGQYQKKLLWIVGPKRNVFHELADRHFTSWTACLKALKKLPKGGEHANA